MNIAQENPLEDDLSAIRETARRYLADVATPEHLKTLLEKPGSFDRALWDGAVEQGWPSIASPESLGGLGLGWPGLCMLAEELGGKTASLPLIANAVTIEALNQALGHAGNQDLHERYAARLSVGSFIATLAFAEPGEAGVPEKPTVVLTDGLLNGSKAISAFAAVANVALLHAWDGGGVALVLVPLDQTQARRDVQPTFDQARAAARLHFEGAQAYRLDGGKDGLLQTQSCLALAALATAFEQVGGATACVLMGRDYALERTVFGQPIGRFQAIKHKLADMYWKTEIARGCARGALDAQVRQDPGWLGLAAAARVAATDAYDFAAQENAQTHGGIGLTWEGMPHHHSRRARALGLELGSRQFWRDRLLDQVGFIAEKA